MSSVSLASSAPELEAPQLMCSGPYMLHGRVPVRCGQCMACRIARKRAVVARAMLERLQHRDACCGTLTYSDEFVGDYQVRSADWVHARDRLRYQVETDLGVKLRFFGIGEYGSDKGRPHWHVVAFGLPWSAGQEYFERAWRDPRSGDLMGRVGVGDADLAAMEYVAGYALKKLTVPGDRLLGDRAPEFVIRPTRPGLGLGYVAEIAQAIVSEPAVLEAVLAAGDIPAQLRVGGALQGIDKYMRNALRDVIFGEGGAELAREARKANYLAECAIGQAEHGRLWSMGFPAVAHQRIRNHLGRVAIYASAKVRSL